MKTFIYKAKFEPGQKRGRIVVSFPDVPEAITEGRNMAEARAMAADALEMALLTYPERDISLPVAKAKGKDLIPIAVDAQTAAKLALLEAFKESGISKSALAAKLDMHEKEARRILDPKHATKLPVLTRALAALNYQLVIGVEKAA